MIERMMTRAMKVGGTAGLLRSAKHIVSVAAARAVSSVVIASALAATACEDSSKKSESEAKKHVAVMATWLAADLQEVRKGLPEGAKHLVKLYEGETLPADDLPAVRAGLERARNKVQDLRIAKSTFFALADPKGLVLRNDRDQDLMAGKGLFGAFPELEQALEKDWVETTGKMKEAASVNDGDAQWIAATPVKVSGEVKGLYVSGWSWSAYAYRLQNGIVSEIRPAPDSKEKMPLVYAFVVVGGEVFRGYETPEINATTIKEQQPLEKIDGDAIFSTRLEITGRAFGLAARRVPSAGKDVAVAVLRSET